MPKRSIEVELAWRIYELEALRSEVGPPWQQLTHGVLNSAGHWRYDPARGAPVNPTPVPSPALLRHVRLTEAPETAANGRRQEKLAEAHALAVASARERLQRSISISVDPTFVDPTSRDLADDDETISDPAEVSKPLLPRFGRLAGYRPNDHRPADILRPAIQAAWGPGSPVARLVATEHMVALDAGDDDESIDPRSAEQLMRRLNDGWQLRVTQPFGLSADLQVVMDDLAVGFGPTETTLVYGLRSALGAPPNAAPGARLLVQLAGTRSVLLQRDGDQNQLRIDAGSVLYVPPEQVVSHLPLDVETLHLDVWLRPDSAETEPQQDAMARVRVSGDYQAAQAVAAADPQIGWPLRLVAPGGAHVVADSDEIVVVVGACELALNQTGFDVLVELAKGDFATGAELAEVVASDPTDVVAFCEALWGLGLLDPAIPADPVSRRTGERLTQVASTTLEDTGLRDRLLASVKEEMWRTPEPGAVHHGSTLDVSVQPVEGDDALSALAQLTDIAASMNQQFFGADISRLDPDDPPLLVRVRAATPTSASIEPQLGSDLVGAHNDRKITFVFSISEADGGWVQLPAGSNTAVSDVGGLSAWASFRPWTLSPVDEGERLFLLGRLHGPAFR